MEQKRKFHERVKHYFNDNRIRNTLIKGIAGYLIIVLVFGIFFYYFDSLAVNVSTPGGELS